MLTTTQTARALGVTPRRVRALIKSGALPATKHGRAWIVTEAAVQGLNRRSAGRPRRTAMKFIELGHGEFPAILSRLPIRSGGWTIIRDDDAAAVGASPWWAANAPSPKATAAYEASGGTASAVYVTHKR